MHFNKIKQELYKVAGCRASSHHHNECAECLGQPHPDNLIPEPGHGGLSSASLLFPCASLFQHALGILHFSRAVVLLSLSLFSKSKSFQLTLFLVRSVFPKSFNGFQNSPVGFVYCSPFSCSHSLSLSLFLLIFLPSTAVFKY